MRKEDLDNDEEITVTLTLEDDSELECTVLTVFEAAGREYIALLPTTGEDAENGDVYLYRFIETDDEEPGIEDIEDDEEFQIASDAFDEYLDNIEFDELIIDDEE